MSYLLTSPHDRTREEVEDFIARCISPDWFAVQYRSREATVGALAGATRSVALDDREWLGPIFCHPELWRRVQTEQPTKTHSPRHVAEWLQLFGAARLLDPGLLSVQPTPLPQLCAALELLPPGRRTKA